MEQASPVSVVANSAAAKLFTERGYTLRAPDGSEVEDVVALLAELCESEEVARDIEVIERHICFLSSTLKAASF